MQGREKVGCTDGNRLKLAGDGLLDTEDSSFTSRTEDHAKAHAAAHAPATEPLPSSAPKPANLHDSAFRILPASRHVPLHTPLTNHRHCLFAKPASSPPVGPAAASIAISRSPMTFSNSLSQSGRAMGLRELEGGEVAETMAEVEEAGIVISADAYYLSRVLVRKSSQIAQFLISQRNRRFSDPIQIDSHPSPTSRSSSPSSTAEQYTIDLNSTARPKSGP